MKRIAVFVVIFCCFFVLIVDKLLADAYRQPIRMGNESAKAIALTFDDGPSEYTDRILDILKEKRVKATFFIVGKAAEKNRRIIERMIQEGHELEIHASSFHIHFDKLSRETQKKHITECVNTLANIAANHHPLFFRPPYGVFNADTIKAANRCGLMVANWSVDPKDWSRHSSVETIVSHCVRQTKGGSIILLHDGDSYGSGKRDKTVSALSKIIDSLKDKFNLVTLRILLESEQSPM